MLNEINYVNSLNNYNNDIIAPHTYLTLKILILF